MDRRTFLRRGSTGMASLMLAQSAFALDYWPKSNANGLARLEDKPLTRIAFGSCNQSHLDQKHWDVIARDNPDIWIWLGDNIYADGTSMEERIRRYLSLKDNSYYKNFRQTVPIIGTWDDHDFASNNMDGHFTDKAASKIALLDFLDVPQSAKVWNHSGVYQSYVLGPPGQQTHIILLDLRYNMNKTLSTREILGEDQWQWLAEEVAGSSADLLVIGSSLNLTSPVVGLGLEGWTEYGAEKRRLLELLASVPIPTIVLSGDRHFAEVARIQLPNGKPIYEVMSSGLTHANGIKLPHPGQLATVVGYKNYGVLAIDWTISGPQVRMQIHSTGQYGTLKEIMAKFA
ncbi:alkaline phosphatase D family protein [Oligoflexus tunisiensis]|uniref:alkaline phosphatase D family protein n=1 Tax=Oligoflexus tunisiensis TaxID=708132 RepID=UPI000B19637D|nr:alkaline phosphatase D family protein [Oligoflexus tunisiensis]